MFNKNKARKAQMDDIYNQIKEIWDFIEMLDDKTDNIRDSINKLINEFKL